MGDESDAIDVNDSIRLRPLQEQSETESNDTPAHDEAFAFEGRFGKSPGETMTPAPKKEWMPVLVGLTSVCIVIILPFTVLNHIKLQTQGELKLALKLLRAVCLSDCPGYARVHLFSRNLICWLKHDRD